MDERALILFDGVCNLCDATVRFIIANDPAGRFRFAALQSAAAARALAAYGRDAGADASVILIDRRGLHERSAAALAIARELRAPWCWLAPLVHLPAPLRDAIYDAVARNRYRWFGRRATCALPDARTRARFISEQTP